MSILENRVARALFIVPAAHYRIFDTGLQIELYELFHRKAACRIGHIVCTPAILLGLYLGAHRLDAALPWALSALLWLSALRVDLVVGLAMLAPIALVHLTAAFVPAPLCAPLGLGLVLGGTLLQTLSHAVEDVPPPTSGTRGFTPVLVWLKAAGARRLVRTALLSLFVFTLLELWAATRVWPLQALHALMRLGYRPDLKRRVDRRVFEILDDPERAFVLPAKSSPAAVGGDLADAFGGAEDAS